MYGFNPNHGRVHFDGVTDDTRARAEALRQLFGADIGVNSAFRTPEEHAAIYRRLGKPAPPNSRHLSGNALDLDMSGMDTETRRHLLNSAIQSGFNGFGFYGDNSNLLHVDSRPSDGSWGGLPGWAAGIKVPGRSDASLRAGLANELITKAGGTPGFNPHAGQPSRSGKADQRAPQAPGKPPSQPTNQPPLTGFDAVRDALFRGVVNGGSGAGTPVSNFAVNMARGMRPDLDPTRKKSNAASAPKPPGSVGAIIAREMDRAMSADSPGGTEITPAEAAGIEAMRKLGTKPSAAAGNKPPGSPGALLARLVNEAMSADSPGGSEITPEEQANINKADETLNRLKYRREDRQSRNTESLIDRRNAQTQIATLKEARLAGRDEFDKAYKSSMLALKEIEAERRRLESESRTNDRDADNTRADRLLQLREDEAAIREELGRQRIEVARERLDVTRAGREIAEANAELARTNTVTGAAKALTNLRKSIRDQAGFGEDLSNAEVDAMIKAMPEGAALLTQIERLQRSGGSNNTVSIGGSEYTIEQVD